MAIMFGNDNTVQTRDAINNPVPGDRYTEMFSFWLYVIGVIENIVITLEASSPATLPDDGEIKVCSVKAFDKRLSYGNGVDGYWVRLVDRGNNIDGWMEAKKQEVSKAIREYVRS